MSTSKITPSRNGTPRLQTPTDLGANASKDIAGAINALVADVFALYLKTKNFHWHMSGPHFRDYHLLLDEHADQIFAITVFAALRLAFSTINDSLGAQPDAELAQSLPPEVREAVTYGRPVAQAPAT